MLLEQQPQQQSQQVYQQPNNNQQQQQVYASYPGTQLHPNFTKAQLDNVIQELQELKQKTKNLETLQNAPIPSVNF